MLSIELIQGHKLLKYTIMKTIQFILSILVAICASAMVYGAVTTYSHMQTMSIVFTSIMLVGSLVLTHLTYKEL